MSPKLDSTTRTTVWHTRNTNLQLLSTGSWLLNMESRKVHWRFLQTGSKLNGVSHLFHISPVAPPSHHVRPVTSVPSLGAAAPAILRLDGGARSQQRLDYLQVAFPSRNRQGPVASARGLRWWWRHHAQFHMSIIFRLKHISYRISGLKNWEFGFRLKHILVSATCLESVSTKKQSQLDWEVTAAHLEQPAQPSSLSLLRCPPSSSTCSRLRGSICSKRRTAPTLPSFAACRMSPPQSRNSGCLAVQGFFLIYTSGSVIIMYHNVIIV